MPTPDYTRGWKAALAKAARQFDAAGWGWQAGHLRALDREANIAAAYAAEPAPACRVGGPPPEPWPGMWVEIVVGSWCHRESVSVVERDAVGGACWRIDVGAEMLPYDENNIAAVFDGRVCIWRAR